MLKKIKTELELRKGVRLGARGGSLDSRVVKPRQGRHPIIFMRNIISDEKSRPFIIRVDNKLFFFVDYE
jgi:hypothetical protein